VAASWRVVERHRRGQKIWPCWQQSTKLISPGEETDKLENNLARKGINSDTNQLHQNQISWERTERQGSSCRSRAVEQRENSVFNSRVPASHWLGLCFRFQRIEQAARNVQMGEDPVAGQLRVVPGDAEMPAPVGRLGSSSFPAPPG